MTLVDKVIVTAVGTDLGNNIALVSEENVTAGDGEVVVEVEAAPVSGADALFAMGWFGVHPDVPVRHLGQQDGRAGNKRGGRPRRRGHAATGDARRQPGHGPRAAARVRRPAAR